LLLFVTYAIEIVVSALHTWNKFYL